MLRLRITCGGPASWVDIRFRRSLKASEELDLSLGEWCSLRRCDERLQLSRRLRAKHHPRQAGPGADPLQRDLDRASAEVAAGGSERAEGRVERTDLAERCLRITEQPLQKRAPDDQPCPALRRPTKVSVRHAAVEHVEWELHDADPRILDGRRELLPCVDGGPELLGPTTDERRCGCDPRILCIEHYVRIMEVEDIDRLPSKPRERGFQLSGGLHPTGQFRVESESRTVEADAALSVAIGGRRVERSDPPFERRRKQRRTMVSLIPRSSHDPVLLGELGRPENDLHGVAFTRSAQA